MRILNTRPKSDSDAFANDLRAAGHTVVSSPMLEIEYLACPAIDPANTQGLIVTSRNALRALSHADQLPQLLGVPLFAVGAASARLARLMGFTDVVAGTAGGAELAQQIAAHCDPAGHRLVHLAGDTRAFDLETVLSKAGYDVETIVTYRAHRAQNLSPSAVAALGSRTLDLVILMSPRTAETFAALAQAEGLDDAAAGLDYACISEATAKALAKLPLAREKVHVAQSPTAAALLQLVNRISPQSSY